MEIPEIPPEKMALANEIIGNHGPIIEDVLAALRRDQKTSQLYSKFDTAEKVLSGFAMPLMGLPPGDPTQNLNDGIAVLQKIAASPASLGLKQTDAENATTLAAELTKLVVREAASGIKPDDLKAQRNDKRRPSGPGQG